jgi:hypothetical protein
MRQRNSWWGCSPSSWTATSPSRPMRGPSVFWSLTPDAGRLTLDARRPKETTVLSRGTEYNGLRVRKRREFTVEGDYAQPTRDRERGEISIGPDLWRV